MTRCLMSFWLLGPLACGGLEDETRFGAAPNGGAGQTPPSDSGAVTTAPLLPGEYAIAVPALGEQSPVHVSVLSATEGVVTLRYGEPVQVSIEAPGEALAVGAVSPGDRFPPPPGLSGAYVLRASDQTSAFFLRAIALGAGLNAAGERDALLLRQVYAQPPRCLELQSLSWETSPGTMRRDTEGTETRVLWHDPFLPWASIPLQAAKPLAGTPLLSVDADGIEIVPRWYSESTVRHAGALPNWTELGGRTLQVSGTVVATNGVESAIEPVSIPVFDLGAPRSEPLTFGTVPEGLATWGADAVSHVPPGTDPACAAGCLRIATGGAIGLRWQGPLANIRVRHRDDVGGWAVHESSLDITLASLSSPGYGVYAAPRPEFWDEEIPVVGADPDVFLWLSVPPGQYNTQSDLFCAFEFDQSTLIESIAVVPR